MTAIPDWELGGQPLSDAELVAASAAGDQGAFAQIYDRYADRLHDFCIGMLADRDGAADCVQDTFCIAATRLRQLRDPQRLRPWLYAIARSEVLRRIRERRRETPSDDLPDTASADPSPDTLAARMELADLVAEAAGGLSDRDRSVLELAFRHGLGGPDLADALGVTPANANTIVHRLRETVQRSLGALLVSRRVRSSGGCPELAEILDGWDGQFTVLMRKRISRHIESCAVCDEERRRLVSPVALLGAAPVFIPAPAWLRERTLTEVELTSASRSLSGQRRDQGYLLPATLFLGALVAAMALIFLWFGQDDAAVSPVEVSQTMPPPPPPPTAAITPTPSVKPTPRSVAPPTSAPPARVTTPTAEPSAAEPPPAADPPPPVIPPEPPPVTPPLPPWPEWPPQPPPPPPPPGGGITGPGDLVAPPGEPPRGSAVP
ncbi:sigma-70 family RNA polymerase sigma factor [Mycobacterium sp. B14F4]|uniref:RNA polymerase sigma factor n=1 Tax=Mycobacterium sp. B14F4 TaxID=3153565 RepID=UPI00325CA882